jgi:uncharacterized membrane protein HdeD (DUF308 family)
MAGRDEKLQQSAAGMRDRVTAQLGQLWLGYFIRGVLALVLGLAALFWPKATIGLLIQLVGIFAILNGAASLYSTWRARLPRSYQLTGWISVGVGAVLLIMPGVTVHLLFLLVGIWAVFQGSSLFMMSRDYPSGDPDRGLLTGIAVAGVLIGLVLIFWPGSGAVAVSWVIAAVALVTGSMLVYMGLHLRHAGQDVRREWQ